MSAANNKYSGGVSIFVFADIIFLASKNMWLCYEVLFYKTTDS
jgi:hypothetical protein